MFTKILTATLLFLLGCLTESLLASLPTWLLWNAAVPGAFGLPSLSWPETLGLVLMINIVTKTRVSFEV